MVTDSENNSKAISEHVPYCYFKEYYFSNKNTRVVGDGCPESKVTTKTVH